MTKFSKLLPLILPIINGEKFNLDLPVYKGTTLRTFLPELADFDKAYFQRRSQHESSMEFEESKDLGRQKSLETLHQEGSQLGKKLPPGYEDILKENCISNLLFLQFIRVRAPLILDPQHCHNDVQNCVRDLSVQWLGNSNKDIDQIEYPVEYMKSSQQIYDEISYAVGYYARDDDAKFPQLFAFMDLIWFYLSLNYYEVAIQRSFPIPKPDEPVDPRVEFDKNNNIGSTDRLLTKRLTFIHLFFPEVISSFQEIFGIGNELGAVFIPNATEVKNFLPFMQYLKLLQFELDFGKHKSAAEIAAVQGDVAIEDLYSETEGTLDLTLSEFKETIGVTIDCIMKVSSTFSIESNLTYDINEECLKPFYKNMDEWHPYASSVPSSIARFLDTHRIAQRYITPRIGHVLGSMFVSETPLTHIKELNQVNSRVEELSFSGATDLYLDGDIFNYLESPTDKLFHIFQYRTNLSVSNQKSTHVNQIYPLELLASIQKDLTGLFISHIFMQQSPAIAENLPYTTRDLYQQMVEHQQLDKNYLNKTNANESERSHRDSAASRHSSFGMDEILAQTSRATQQQATKFLRQTSGRLSQSPSLRTSRHMSFSRARGMTRVVGQTLLKHTQVSMAPMKLRQTTFDVNMSTLQQTMHDLGYSGIEGEIQSVEDMNKMQEHFSKMTLNAYNRAMHGLPLLNAQRQGDYAHPLLNKRPDWTPGWLYYEPSVAIVNGDLVKATKGIPQWQDSHGGLSIVREYLQNYLKSIPDVDFDRYESCLKGAHQSYRRGSHMLNEPCWETLLPKGFAPFGNVFDDLLRKEFKFNINLLNMNKIVDFITFLLNLVKEEFEKQSARMINDLKSTLRDNSAEKVTSATRVSSSFRHKIESATLSFLQSQRNYPETTSDRIEQTTSWKSAIKDSDILKNMHNYEECLSDETKPFGPLVFEYNTWLFSFTSKHVREPKDISCHYRNSVVHEFSLSLLQFVKRSLVIQRVAYSNKDKEVHIEPTERRSWRYLGLKKVKVTPSKNIIKESMKKLDRLPKNSALSIITSFMGKLLFSKQFAHFTPQFTKSIAINYQYHSSIARIFTDMNYDKVIDHIIVHLGNTYARLGDDDYYDSPVPFWFKHFLEQVTFKGDHTLSSLRKDYICSKLGNKDFPDSHPCYNRPPVDIHEKLEQFKDSSVGKCLIKLYYEHSSIEANVSDVENHILLPYNTLSDVSTSMYSWPNLIDTVDPFYYYTQYYHTGNNAVKIMTKSSNFKDFLYRARDVKGFSQTAKASFMTDTFYLKNWLNLNAEKSEIFHRNLHVEIYANSIHLGTHNLGGADANRLIKDLKSQLKKCPDSVGEDSRILTWANQQKSTATEENPPVYEPSEFEKDVKKFLEERLRMNLSPMFKSKTHDL